MAGSSVIPRSDADKLAFIQHLNATLPTYAANLGFSADDLAELERATAWYQFAVNLQTAGKAYSEATVAFRNAVKDGSNNGAPTVPVLPVANPPPGEPFQDINDFLSTIIARVKLHKNYAEAIGKALNIIATQSAAVDLTAVQPILNVEFHSSHPRILWVMHGMDALEIEVDRGDGHFTLFTIDTTPNHTDTTPLPPAGTVVLWKYRAIYRVRDERVGQWSQVLEVSVKGV